MQPHFWSTRDYICFTYERVCVQLVRPEEIAGRNADEEALLTYLAKFPVVAQSRFEERVMGVYKCSGNGALTGTSSSSGFDDP